MAARAMESTGRPVGLLVWRGRHAWVMSGFKATKDPFKAGARVTELSGLGHWWMLQDPARGAEVLEGFWDSV